MHTHPIRRIAARVAVSVIVGVILALLAPLLARAEGVPAAALPACGPPSDRGGWNVRQFVSSGTDSDLYDNVAVRPRTFTLGEPCQDVEGIWSIPLAQTEVAQDYDETAPESGGTSGAAGHQCAVFHSGSELDASVFETLGPPDEVVPASPNTAPVNCDRTNLADLAHGDSRAYDPFWPSRTTSDGVPLTFSTVGDRTLRMVATDPGGTSGFGFRVWVSCRQTGSPFNFTAVQSAGFGDVPSSPTDLVCSTGSAPFAAVVGYWDKAGTGRWWGVAWRADGLSAAGLPPVVNYTQSSITMMGGLSAPLGEADGYFACAGSRNGDPTVTPMSEAYYFRHNYFPSDYAFGLPVNVAPGENNFTRLDYLRFWPGADSDQCPYLVEVGVNVCRWTGFSFLARTCTMAIWKYDDYIAHTPYTDPDPLTDACSQQPDNNALEVYCYPIEHPEFTDYALFENACPNPPAAEWLSFTWIPEAIGYYAQCLFVPQGGGDANGEVRAALGKSAVGVMVDQMGQLGSTLDVAESCGTLVDATGQIVPLVIDTCDWTWASPVKLLLSAVLWVLFAVWVLYFVTSLLRGLVNRRTPSPLSEGADD